MRKTEPIFKTCPVCNTHFPVCPPGKSSRTFPKNSQVFCSPVCASQARYRSSTLCNRLSPTDAAYIAGFLDGDGSILLYKRTRKVAMRVAFANNDPDLIDWICRITGLGSTVPYDDGHPHHAIRYQTQINADAACTLLEQLVPYLRRKLPQAQLAITHQKTLLDPALNADFSWQLENYQRMCKLNKRGL